MKQLRRGSSHAIAGLRCTDLWIDVPVYHDAPQDGTLEIYAREVVDASAAHEERPWLIYLQGGPGFGGPRPVDESGWIGRAVKDYRVLLLDSRGTGRSTPLTAHSIAELTIDDAERYLLAHRADSIVRDAELLRQQLPGSPNWTVLGQSYGGFCAVTYLSFAPQWLDAVMITGGIPPFTATPAEIYQHTYPMVEGRNDGYHKSFRDDAEALARIVARLDRGDVTLPNGDVLTPERLQATGLVLGFEDGAANIHHLVEQAFEADGDELTLVFRKGVEQLQNFDTNPIFSVLHEAAYTVDGAASDWAAQRQRQAFAMGPDHSPFPFTGEMIYPWMFDQVGALRPFAAVAERLAQRTTWPPLYDLEALKDNQVPTMAAVYDEDIYVERTLSLAAAEQITNLQVWTTPDYQHCALRRHGKFIFDQLTSMLGPG